MAVGVTYKTLVDARPIGSELIVKDYTLIPLPAAPGYVSYRILELPLNVITPPSLTQAVYVQAVDPVTHVATGQVFTAVTYPTLPASGQFQIDPAATFTFGTITFNGLDGGTTVEITVTGRGSLLFASDVNDPQDELTDARNGEASLGTRVRALASGVDIASGAIKPRHISTTGTDVFTFPGDCTINGSLDVKGAVTYVESTTYNVGDNFINLNTAEAGSPTLDSGITIHRGSSASVTSAWRESSGYWELTGGGLNLPTGGLNLHGGAISNASFGIVANQTAETALTKFDGMLIYRSDIHTAKVYNSGTSAFISLGMSMSRVDYVVGTPSGSYSGSTTVFGLPWTYNVAANQLMVFENGLLQDTPTDYTETNSTTVTAVAPLAAGAHVSFVNFYVNS